MKKLYVFLILTFVITLNINAQYCGSNATNTSDEDIFNVSIGALNNSSTCGTTGGGASILNRYSDYTGLTAPNLITNLSYNFSVSIGTCGGSFGTGAAAFIDYNADGDFVDAGEKIYSSPGTTASSPTFTLNSNVIIPTGATAGNTRMRVMAVEGSTGAGITPCLNFGWGETEDYNVNIVIPAACTGKPVVGAAASSKDSVCPSDAFTVSLPGLTYGSNMTFQWQSSTNNIIWTNMGVPSLPYVSVPAGIPSTLYYRCIVTCNNSGLLDSSTSVKVVLKTIMECYCSKIMTQTTPESNIFNVSISNLSNTSNCNTSPPTSNSIQNKFMDFSTTVAPASLIQGLAYPFSAKVGTCTSNNWGAGVAAFIDYNRDGDFVDAGERIYDNGGQPNVIPAYTATGIVTIPTVNAGTAKMRVISSTFENGSTIQPCGTFNWGEVEDYAVNLVIPTPCTGTPVTGATSSSMDTVCPSDVISLGMPSFIYGTGMNFQWQSSTDNIIFSNMAVPNAPAVTVTNIQVTTWYRCIVTCTNSGLTSTSTAKRVVARKIMDCYCSATATTPDDEDIFNVTMGSINNTTTCTSPTPTPSSVQNQYMDYSSTIAPAKIYQGLQYNFSTTIGSCGGNFTTGAAAFIDFNRDGDFIDAGEKIYSSPGTTASIPNFTLNGLFTAPTVSQGLAKMRVLAVEGSTGAGITPCNTGFGWGEVEDYAVNLVVPVPCTGTPNVGIATTSLDSTCPTSLVIFSIPNIDYALNLNIQWEESLDNSVWTNMVGAPNAPTFSITGLTTSKYYRCKVTCTNSGLFAYSTVKFVFAKPLFKCHCVSKAVSNLVEDIVKVQFASINNSSSCSSTGGSGSIASMYSDYTSTVTYPKVKRGLKYPMNVDITPCNNPGFASGTKGFIDWNANGVMTLPAENVFSALNFNQPNPSQVMRVGASISVPTTATPSIVLLRVVNNSLATTAAVSPCGQYNYGETEDYGVEVVGFNDDVAIMSIDSPFTKCGIGNENIYVTVYNAGSNSASNFDISYSVDGGAPVSFNYTGTINSYTSASVSLPTPYNFSVPKTYNIKVWSSLSTDGDRSDDTMSVNIESMASPVDPIPFHDTVCIGTPIALISAQSQPGYTTYWMTSMSPNTIFKSGDNHQVLNPTGNYTFYAKSILESKTKIGEDANASFLGFNETNTGKGLIFDVDATFININSIAISTTSIGSYSVIIQNSAGVTIFTQTQFITTPGTNRIIFNNCRIYKGTNYRISFSINPGSRSLFSGANYPFVAPRVMKIKSTTVGLTDQYPYFYDWDVSYPICESNPIPVNIVYSANPAPVQFLGPDTTACSFPGITLDAGNPGNSYTWNDGSTSRKKYTNVAGVYSVKVRNQFGCKQADTINVNINPSPEFNLGNDTSVCENNNLVLKSGFNNNGFSHTWYTNPGQYSTSIPVTNSGKYIAQVLNTFNKCFYYDTIDINVNPSPKVELFDDTTFCKGSITLDAGAGANYSYLWSPSNATTQTIQTTTSANYKVTVVDNSFTTKCSTVDSKNVIVGIANALDLGKDTAVCNNKYTLTAPFDPNYTYLWSNGSKSSSIDVTTGGVYYVEVKEIASGCINVDTVTLSFSAYQKPDLGPDIPYCGASRILTGPLGYNSYSWNGAAPSLSNTFIVNTSGQYILEVNSNCGTKSDTVNVALETLPVVKLPNDTIVCAPLTISAGNQPVGNKYKWSNNATTNSTTVTSSGTYWVNVENSCGIATDAINVTYQTQPTINYTLNIMGNQVSVVNSSTSVSSYYWLVNGVLVSTNQNPVLLFNKSGANTIKLVVKNACGDSATKEEIVNVIASKINTIELNSLNLYPNPTSDYLNINADGLVDGVYSIQLIDISGRIVKIVNASVTNSKLTESVKVNDLSSGEYIVKISDQFNHSINGTITVR